MFLRCRFLKVVLFLVIFSFPNQFVFSKPLHLIPSGIDYLEFGVLEEVGDYADFAITLSHSSQKKKADCGPGGSQFDEMTFLTQSHIESSFPHPFSTIPSQNIFVQGVNQKRTYIIRCQKSPLIPVGYYTGTLYLNSGIASSFFGCGDYEHQSIAIELACYIDGPAPTPTPVPTSTPTPSPTP